MKVVIIGTGRIGCGYLADLFAGAGWEVLLATRSAATLQRIGQLAHYGVRVTGVPATPTSPPVPPEIRSVRNFRPVRIGTAEFDRAVAAADLLCVSVGVRNVVATAAPLAKALASRDSTRPIDVWVVENDDCAAALEAEVRRCAADQPLPPVGFGGAVAHVAVARGSWHDQGRPEFVGDAARRMYVDSERLVTPVPQLPDVHTTRNYRARLREKLYVFNAGHAICAYLGWLRGHATIAEAAADRFLRPMVAGTLLESRRALLAAYPSLGSDVSGPVAEALRRFADVELADPVVRVARDPIRKLGPHDRLLGAVDTVRAATGDVPPYFSLGVAGSLLYAGDTEDQTLELRGALARRGVMAVLQDVCGLAPEDPFALAVAERYRGFILTPEETVFPPVYTQAPSTALRGLAATLDGPA